MKLIKYEGYNITIAPEALLLKPFAALWKRDRSKSKQRALDELGFIYFYANPRSDYSYLVDDEARIKAIKEGLGYKENWKPDKLLNEAIDFYKSFSTISEMLLQSTRSLAHKVIDHMENLDLDERDNNDKPIFALNMVIGAIERANSLVLKIDETEKKIASESVQKGAMRGQGEKTIFEDSLTI